MSIKKIFSPAASTISLFIFIFYFAINSNAEDNNSKYYSKDEGVVSIMYHRFNENKYPSTNIQMDIFKEHIRIIQNSGFKFHYPNKFKEQFETVKLNCPETISTDPPPKASTYIPFFTDLIISSLSYFPFIINVFVIRGIGAC